MELLLSRTFVSAWTFVFFSFSFLGKGLCNKIDESISSLDFLYQEVESICVPARLFQCLSMSSMKCPTASLQKAPVTYYIILQGNIPKVHFNHQSSSVCESHGTLKCLGKLVGPFPVLFSSILSRHFRVKYFNRKKKKTQ